MKKLCMFISFSFAALIVISCASTGTAADTDTVSLPSVNVGKAELDTKVWTQKQVDGRDCALLAAGKRGTIPVPVWWGKSLRPKKGASFLCRIEFKDVVSSPIIVKAYAGLPGFYEIHRIGGLNDNTWKTALLPLPWDMVMRIKGTDNTEIHISNPGEAELPVSKLTIEKGDPFKDE